MKFYFCLNIWIELIFFFIEFDINIINYDFFRYRWETIRMYGVTFQDNTFEALHVPSITKYHELYLPTFEELQNQYKIAEITYEVDSCYFKQNGGGVLGEHNHVEFSNNVWIWEVTNNHFEENYGGGFSIELPKVNLMYSELYNHSVDINDTIFENNENFEFRIDGFYCNSSIARNRFHGNLCKTGCITITGTEKDFEMHENEITENQGKYVIIDDFLFILWRMGRGRVKFIKSIPGFLHNMKIIKNMQMFVAPQVAEWGRGEVVKHIDNQNMLRVGLGSNAQLLFDPLCI